jgi:hypothetical protein
MSNGESLRVDGHCGQQCSNLIWVHHRRADERSDKLVIFWAASGHL